MEALITHMLKMDEKISSNGLILSLPALSFPFVNLIPVVGQVLYSAGVFCFYVLPWFYFLSAGPSEWWYWREESNALVAMESIILCGVNGGIADTKYG